MRAARVTGKGLSSLRVEDVAVPGPADDDVLIEVATVGANRLDLNVIHGVGPGAKAQLPRVLGIDPAGTIVAQGRAVGHDRTGERVVVKPNIPCGRCAFCRSGNEGDCPAQTIVGVHRDGGAAEYVAVPARNALPIADTPFETATAAVHSVPIALHCIKAGGGIRPGMRVLVTGASGAVGSAAVQVAVHLGADVIAAARSELTVPAEATALRFAEPDELTESLRAVAPGRMDLVLDATGSGAVIGAVAPVLDWKGVIVLCAASTDSEIRLDARTLYLNRQSVIGTASADYADVTQGLSLVASGVVQPLVGSRSPLAEIGTTYARLQSGSTHGKQVVYVCSDRA